MRYLLVLSLLTGCVTPAFYVKTGDRLGKVTVNECRVTSFVSMDDGKTVDKSYCRKVQMSAAQKTTWERIAPFDASEALHKGKKVEDEDDK